MHFPRFIPWLSIILSSLQIPPPNGEASSTHTIQHCFISITLILYPALLSFCINHSLKSLFACLSSLLECTFMRIKDLVWPVFCYVPSAQQYLCVADAPKICAKGTKLGQTLVADATCPGGKQFKKHNTGSLPARGLHLYYAIILRIIQCCNIEIELRGHHLLLSPFLPLAEWFWMASICTMNFFLFFFTQSIPLNCFRTLSPSSSLRNRLHRNI